MKTAPDLSNIIININILLLVHLLHSEHYQNYVVNGTETFHNLPVYNLFDKEMKMNLDTISTLKIVIV